MKAICSVMILISISSCYGTNKKVTCDTIKNELVSSLKTVDDFHYALGKLNYYLEDSLIELAVNETSEDKEARKQNRNYKTKGKSILDTIQKYSKITKDGYRDDEYYWDQASYTIGIDCSFGKYVPNLFDAVRKPDDLEIPNAIDIHRYIAESKELSAFKKQLLDASKKTQQKMATYGILGYLSIIDMIQKSNSYVKHTYGQVISEKAIDLNVLPSGYDISKIKPQLIKCTGLAFFINGVHYNSGMQPKILFIPVYNKFNLDKDVTLSTAISSVYTMDMQEELIGKLNHRKDPNFTLQLSGSLDEYFLTKMSMKHTINGMLKKSHGLPLPKPVVEVPTEEIVQENDLQIINAEDQASIEVVPVLTDITVENSVLPIEQIQTVEDEKIVTEPYHTRYTTTGKSGQLTFYGVKCNLVVPFKIEVDIGMQQVEGFLKILETILGQTPDENKSKMYLTHVADKIREINKLGTTDQWLLFEIMCINAYFSSNKIATEKFYEEYIDIIHSHDFVRLYIETVSTDIHDILRDFKGIDRKFYVQSDTNINKLIRKEVKTFKDKYLEYSLQKYRATPQFYCYDKTGYNGNLVYKINKTISLCSELDVIFEETYDDIRTFGRLLFAFDCIVYLDEDIINQNMDKLQTCCKLLADKLTKHKSRLNINDAKNTIRIFQEEAKNDSTLIVNFKQFNISETSIDSMNDLICKSIESLQRIKGYREYQPSLYALMHDLDTYLGEFLNVKYNIIGG